MPRLAIHLLGSYQVLRDDRPITDFRSDKARALLAYLALETDRPHPRDALAGLLWPDSTNSTARANLRLTLHRLRQALNDAHADTQPALIHVTSESIQFNTSIQVWLDVRAVDQLLSATQAHAHQRIETCAACIAKLHEATELYRGDFLQGFFVEDSLAFSEWATVRREGLHQRMLEALYHLAEHHRLRGENDAALKYARRQIEMEPWREEAHRQVMSALARKGERSAALEQYAICRETMLKEFDAVPSLETEELHQRILQLDVRRHNLPPASTPFIGRETELAEIAARLSDPDCRLLTLLGPGGIGKSRLALQIAGKYIGAYLHGVYFVQLTSVGSPDLIASTIASALGQRFAGKEHPNVQLLNYLRNEQPELLLVLDNFEHLLEGANLIAEMLQVAPELNLLATSRERLNLQEEWIFEVDGLAYPERTTIDALEQYDALRLFVQSAQRTAPHYVLNVNETQSVAHICRLVEGMPLAVELAAASVRTSSTQIIAQEIERNLGFLATTLRNVPDRHRSVHAAIDHSWNLLSQDVQRTLSRLSVFRGGFTLEAAEQVASASRIILDTLLDKSLLRVDPTEAQRYELHELIRQYAHERLIEADEIETTCEHHFEFFMQLAEEAEPQLQGPNQMSWLDRLEREHDNLRAALDWTQQDHTLAGLQLAGRMYRFWFLHGYLSEGLGRLSGLLAQSKRDDNKDASFLQARAKVLQGAGVLAWKMGDYATAREYYEEALPIFRESDDRHGVASILGNLAIIAGSEGEFDRARSLYVECRDVFEALGNKRGVGNVLFNLAVLAKRQDDIAANRSLLEESLAIRRELGDQSAIAIVLNALGDTLRRQGDVVAGRAYAEESLRIRKALGDKLGLLECFDILAGISFAENRPDRSARLLSAATALREMLNGHITPADRDENDRFVADVRSRLGDVAFERAWAEGRAMTLEQAIAHALEADAVS